VKFRPLWIVLIAEYLAGYERIIKGCRRKAQYEDSHEYYDDEREILINIIEERPMERSDSKEAYQEADAQHKHKGEPGPEVVAPYPVVVIWETHPDILHAPALFPRKQNFSHLVCSPKPNFS
jgi:hypothetical protein